jgi:hypothetical protein
MKLIFCKHHFKLFRENGIDKVLEKSNSIIRIKKYGRGRQTVCNKENCIDKAEYVIEYD